MPRPIRASAAVDWLANQNPLSVVEWADPVVEAAGHPIRSVYVETFWLPTLGPTAMWLLRRLSAWLEATPDGISVELPELAQELGLGAHLASLRRTRIGPFSLERARTLPALEALAPAERTAPPWWMPLAEVPLPFPSLALLPGEAAKVRRGHAVPVRVPTDATGAPWVRLLAEGDLVALGHLEPLGRGALALAKPKIVLQD